MRAIQVNAIPEDANGFNLLLIIPPRHTKARNLTNTFGSIAITSNASLFLVHYSLNDWIGYWMDGATCIGPDPMIKPIDVFKSIIDMVNNVIGGVLYLAERHFIGAAVNKLYGAHSPESWSFEDGFYLPQ